MLERCSTLWVGKSSCCVVQRSESTSSIYVRCQASAQWKGEAGELLGLASHLPRSRSHERLSQRNKVKCHREDCLTALEWKHRHMSAQTQMCECTWLHARVHTNTHTHTHTHTMRLLDLYLKFSILLSRLLELFCWKALGRPAWWQTFIISALWWQDDCYKFKKSSRLYSQDSILRQSQPNKHK